MFFDWCFIQVHRIKVMYPTYIQLNRALYYLYPNNKRVLLT